MMTMQFKRTLELARAVCVLGVVALLAPGANAGTTGGYGLVQATVQSACNLVATPTISFGTVSSIGPLAAEIDQTGTISVACSNGAPYEVYIGDGNNRVAPGSGNRQMINGTALLPYQLYQSAAHSTIWDNTGGPSTIGGSGGINGTGTGATQNLTVYGVIPAGITVPSVTGYYYDWVWVTIAY
jgi:spore coat protein U-like protein